MVRSHWLASLRGVFRRGCLPRRSGSNRRNQVTVADVKVLETRTLYSAAAVENLDDHAHGDGDSHLDPCVLPPVDPSDPDLALSGTVTAQPGPFPDADTFKLHSRPSATKVIYLDFDGYITTGTPWNVAYNMTTITTPAFDLDGNAGSFNSTELSAIQTAWQRVAESFSPFDVNVTTEDPGIEALRNTGGGDQNWGIRVAIGGSSSGVLGISAGGVAYIGSFNWDSDTPTFVFPDSLAQNEKFIADATAHEVGHTLGLVHDGLSNPVTTYYSGHGAGPTGWAPIMGVGYSKSLVQWSKGEYPSANNGEDDLNIITTQNGFTYRSDDHGNDQPSATDLIASGAGNVSTSGVIERNSDSDWFRFLGSGDINLQFDGAPLTPMLDIQAELYDSAGVLLATSNPVDALSATLSANVPVGYYFVKIDGVGKPPNGNDFGYTEYASIGQFFITGNVGDNFPPVINDQTLNVPEDAIVGTSIGTVVATDPDVGDSITYAITGGDPGNQFSINTATGELTLNGVVDRETTPVYQLTVQVTDLRGLTDTGIVTVNVTDVNEPPSVPAQSFTVFEKSAAGTAVGTVSVNDPDLGQGGTFAILAGNISNAFAINPSTGEITVNNSAAVDYNVIQSFTLTVRYIDGGTPSLIAFGQITIDVLQVNLPPDVPSQGFSLAENSASGTVVGTVVATDANLNQSKAFSIINGNVNGAFAINALTGTLTVANSAALDFETQPTFSLTVRVLDNGVPPLAGLGIITISLSNVNDPPKIDQKIYTVLESAPAGTVVGTVTATDDDVGQTRTFAIVGGNPGNAFKIDSATGVITVNNSAAVDWETTPVFNLQVASTDNGAPPATGTATLKINVTNINDPPTNVTFQNMSMSIAENSANLKRVKVADIVVVDDGLGVHALSLSGADSAAFELDGNALYVRSGTNLDFESKPTYVVTVNADDTSLGNTPDAAANFTVKLTDVNEAPVLPGKVVTLAENSPVGTVVATGLATDPDAGQSLTYAIEAGNRNNAFAINPATGVVTVNNPTALDYENQPPYELKITAVDNGTPNQKSAAILKVILTDRNDAPHLYNAAKSIPENLPVGSVVLDYKIVAKDQDKTQSLTYAISAGNTNNAFAIDPTTGVITVNNPVTLDFENQPPFNLTIAVTDNGTPSLTSTATLRITLTNQNDAPGVYNAEVSLPENSPAGKVVLDYKLVASDQDPFQSLSYAISAGNRGNAFAIDPVTGIITVKTPAALDYESGGPFDLTITVSDDGTPSRTSSANLRVKLTNVNEAPKWTAATVSIAENAAAGSVVLDLKTVASDPDVGQTLKYAIVGGNIGNAFAINANTGVITVNNSAALDFESRPTFDLQVSATDTGTPALTTTATLKVNVQNGNDAPTVTNAVKSIAENLAAGTVVYDFKPNAKDFDVGQTLKYAITGGNIGNAFAINANTGVVTVSNAAALDFETNPKFELKITVTDNGTPALSTTGLLTINLTDVKEGPTISPATFTLPENSAPGVVVGSVTVSPLDPGQTRTFAITAGNTNTAFAINPTTGQITVNNSAALNFEVQPAFTLTITVTDSGTGTFKSTGTIKVNLTNANDAPVIPLQSMAVKQLSAAGTVVGTVVATDPDAGQTRTFAIVSGNGPLNNIFSINAATGQITVNNVLGLLVARQVTLGVRVTDNGSPVLSTIGQVQVFINATGVVPSRNVTPSASSHNSETAGAIVAAVNPPLPGVSPTVSDPAKKTSAFIAGPAKSTVSVSNPLTRLFRKAK